MIMDYEKKYKESMAKMSTFLAKHDGFTISKDGEMYKELSEIFPELKESEGKDGKIRKALIRAFKSLNTIKVWNGIERTDIIDWLEKQGEQKPKFRVGDTIKCKYDDRQFTIKSVDLDKGTYTYTQEGCGNDIDYADEEFELVEQKPVIKMKTPEESLGTDSETYNKIVDECVYGETKSAWSEEDEKAINDIMWIIEAYRENGFNETHIQMADSSENWLKSLKDRYTWRPSERKTQSVRDCALNKNIDADTRLILDALYQDLLKLREK